LPRSISEHEDIKHPNNLFRFILKMHFLDRPEILAILDIRMWNMGLDYAAHYTTMEREIGNRLVKNITSSSLCVYAPSSEGRATRNS
jgi:hypothetical protein